MEIDNFILKQKKLLDNFKEFWGHELEWSPLKLKEFEEQFYVWKENWGDKVSSP